MRNTRRLRFAFLLLPLVPVFVWSCVDERIVFRDRELFAPLPSGAASFVGYTDETRKLTVCGNCHVGPQSRWVNTKHADAWATLQANPGAQAFCEGCHTVNALGNPETGDAGYTATGDVRYHDVQCESCHGPGLDHVQNPESGIPLAPLFVDTMITRGCGECHTGTHHPFVDEWRQSGHGQVRASPAGRVECRGCHTGEDALLAWGVRNDYLEKDSVMANATAHLPITCGVCHDPHSAEIEGQLRFPIDVRSEEENLCMKCHHKRGVPDPTTFRGPHSPEGPLLLGYGGWWPPLLTFSRDTIVGTHGSEANPRLCAGCHVRSYAVTDAETGDFQLNVTGHLFQAIPCLENGIPTTGDCADTERSYVSCTDAGCHGNAAAARNALATVDLRITNLTNTIAQMLTQVPAGEFVDTDNRYTTGEGARFNRELALVPGSGVHNPFLIESLLLSSIAQLQADYGIPVPPGVNLDNTMQKPPR
jgi:predicted CXXCH cytochrome family protein